MELRENLRIYDTDSAFSKGTVTWIFMSTIGRNVARYKLSRR